uniref:Uncharacterized protein n=1 Tax=Arundo donax TaxID=35708 RepID=A0A0A9H1A2_ARUDO
MNDKGRNETYRTSIPVS